MRSALGPCSNDDRMSLCLAAAVKRCSRTKTRQARTCSLFLPVALLCSCSSCAPGSCCCYRAPPLSSPIVYRLGYLHYGYAVTLSLCRHPPTCSLALLALDYRIPILHLDTVLLFSFPLSVQPKHTPSQHLVLLTHSLPSTCPIALSDSNLKAHSTAASISARLSACRASSIAIFLLFLLPLPNNNTVQPPTMSSRKKVLLKVQWPATESLILKIRRF